MTLFGVQYAGLAGSTKLEDCPNIVRVNFRAFGKGGGRAQLKALRANKHAKTGRAIPSAVTEDEWNAGKRTAISTESAGEPQSVHGESRPVRLCQASAAILDRLRMKRRVSQEAHAAIALSRKRRRITGKSTPTTTGGNEVGERVVVEAVDAEHRQDYPA